LSCRVFSEARAYRAGAAGASRRTPLVARLSSAISAGRRCVCCPGWCWWIWSSSP